LFWPGNLSQFGQFPGRSSPFGARLSQSIAEGPGAILSTKVAMSNPVVCKLEQFARLSAEDRSALAHAATVQVRQYAPGEDIIAEGEAPREVNIVLSGWGCRYKQLEDGRRQIIAFLLPGDVCDLNIFILRAMDHTVSALTSLTVAQLSREAFEELTVGHPGVTEALCWEALVNIAIQRTWTVNLGQRNALERVGHLLCELFIRLQPIGLTIDDGCEFPITQSDLAAATGLSVVHVNRTLQELRHSGLIVLHGKRLTIPNLPALMRASLFNPGYLHLDHVDRYLDAAE
jgi:CRP-like cAMP-binding protein